MEETLLLAAILDSLKDPVLVADPEHVIRYMNKAAIEHYEGGTALLGRSLLECHNARSQQMMLDILAAMQHEGIEEQIMTDDDERRGYMCAVRDRDGRLLGYYERYEPPAPK